MSTIQNDGNKLELLVKQINEAKTPEQKIEVLAKIHDTDALNKLWGGEKNGVVRRAITDRISLLSGDEYSGGPQGKPAEKILRKTSVVESLREYPTSDELDGMFDKKPG
ncbi:MAG: hypothetical protein KGH66_01690 [Candidatus Micrarchaeota archaeon]|nr:hypothetical protein [Candidatus Micrarchaeota archaeon]